MPKFDLTDVEIISCERCFQGYFAVDEYQLKHRLYEGGWSEPFKRELFERGHAVAVVLYDPVRDEVVLIEQFRIGAMTSEQSPWMTEVVAGIIEEGETPEAVARREIKEEAGLEVESLKFIGRYFCTPGASSESIYLYCAKVDSERAGGVFGLAHENEDIRAFRRSMDEVTLDLKQAKYENATCLIAMQWLLLNRDDLRRDWL